MDFSRFATIGNEEEEVPKAKITPEVKSNISTAGIDWDQVQNRFQEITDRASKVIEPIEYTDPAVSFGMGAGFSALAQGATGLAKRFPSAASSIPVIGRKMVNAPARGPMGIASKMIGAGLMAVPSMAGYDTTAGLIKQTDFAKENPGMGTAAEIAGGLLTGIGVEGLVRGSIPMVAKGLKLINSIGDNPLVNKVQSFWEKGIWDNSVAPTVNYLTTPEKSLVDNFPVAATIRDKIGAGKLMEIIQKGGRGIREQLEPAIERISKGGQDVLRTNRVQETLLGQEGQRMAQDQAILPLTDKLDYMRGVRGEPLSNLSLPAQTALIESRKRMQNLGLDPEMVSTFQQKQAELYTKLLKSPQDVLTSSNTVKMLEAIENAVPQDAWFRNFKVRKQIKEVMENPLTSDAEHTLLKELYQLPATTPEVSLQAARFAYKANVTKQILGYTGPETLVSPTKLPGFVKTEWGELKDHWVPRDLDLELTALEKIEKTSHGVFNRYFTTPWKTSKIVLSPAAQIRNTFTNFLLNDIGGLPVYRMDIYADSFKKMLREAPEWKEFVRLTGGGGTFSRNELLAQEAAWKYETNWYDIPYKFLEMGAKYPKGVYNANEQLFKFAKFQHNLERGLPTKEAAFDAIKPTFNYGEITPGIARARNYLMPFATWTSKVIPYTFEQAIKHPLRVGKWFAMFEGLQNMAIENSGMSQREWEAYKDKMPEHIQNGLYLLMPYRDDRGRLNMVDLTYMVPGIGDMREMVGKGIWEAIFQHPLITLPADLLRNKKFTGEPIYYDWQPVDVRLSNAAQHAWESIMPNITPTPWSTDWKRYVKAMSEVPGAQTVDQAIAAQFGIKIQPLDPGQIYRLNDSVRKVHETEMTLEMNKALRKTKDPEEKRQIILKFQKYRQQFLKDYLDPRGLNRE